jgi:hypothetical protein
MAETGHSRRRQCSEGHIAAEQEVHDAGALHDRRSAVQTASERLKPFPTTDAGSSILKN